MNSVMREEDIMAVVTATFERRRPDCAGAIQRTLHVIPADEPGSHR